MTDPSPADLRKDQLMEAKHIDFLSPQNDGLDSRLSYNDQGTAAWYKQQYPHFPEEFYQIFEIYSKGGVRFKEYRNFLKKLEKKGKLIRPTSESIDESFKKINLDNDKDELLDKSIPLCAETDLPKL
jgi:NAD-dependent SIR2 family protein deacetylase